MATRHLSTPLSDRGMIVAADQDPTGQAGPSSAGWSVTKKDVGVMGGLVALAPFTGGYSLVPALGYAGYRYITSRRGAPSSGQSATVSTISREEARRLTFPPGHPRLRVVYVRDPAASSVYYPYASFHRRVFESKFAELRRLLESLGATHINVQTSEDWSRAIAAKAAVPGGIVSMHAGNTNTRGQKALYSATYSVQKAPTLPPNLVWYHSERMWQDIAQKRMMDQSMKRFRLQLQYDDSLGINGALAAKLEEYGFELGGTFEEHRSVVWNITVEF